MHGGDRLPWQGDNYEALTALDWRVYIYGETAKPFAEAAAALGLGVDKFTWTHNSAQVGLEHDAAYLVRPDGYVALVLPDQDAEVLRAYVARIGFSALQTGQV